MLVLSGASGRIEDELCRILAREGLTALSIRWFGGVGQPPGICEFPLETFGSAIEVLRAGGTRRIGVLGVSKGAEAALHLSVLLPGVDAVVAVSPTSMTWANVGPGRDGQTRPQRSSRTWRGEPLPFLPYDTSWAPAPAQRGGVPIAIRGWYERSRQTFADRVNAATAEASAGQPVPPRTALPHVPCRPLSPSTTRHPRGSAGRGPGPCLRSRGGRRSFRPPAQPLERRRRGQDSSK